ncbi:MAG TPA: glycosyltransferase [Anaerolineae bacterium]|nr:glycosyltransferase [Anaerolineae bacterium]
MQILFLSNWYPYPPSNGSKLRIYNLLRALAQHHDVTLLTFADQQDIGSEKPTLSKLCREIQVVPRKSFSPSSWRARRGFLSKAPRSVVDTFSSDMEQRIRQTLNARNYDVVIASQEGTAGYSYCFQGITAIFEEVEIGVPYERFAYATSAWQRFRYGLTWIKHRRYLAYLLRDFQACTVVSTREQNLLTKVTPDHQAIEVIPNCIDLADYGGVKGPPQWNHLIFTGSFRYFANYEGMTWFLQDIFPRIQARVPDVQLTITGDHAGLPLPAVNNVILTGFVDDVRPLIASASISLVPLRVGGGTRLKILEAMALGTPVVTTSKGAEGLDVEPGKHLLIADTPSAFAEAIILLLSESRLRQQVVDNAYQLVCQKYDCAAVMPQFLSLIDRVATG